MAIANGSPALRLTDEEQQMLAGDVGPALALAMTVVCKIAEVAGAEQLVRVTSAHIDSCLYHGPAGLDFAERLVAGGARVAVPTTLNVSALDLLHPDVVRLDDETRERARRLMDAYVAMGCEPTWTCAPYQLPSRPSLGEHICWAESNAIVFANSVLGARTGRYGDFIDICAALTGRAPLAGLHTDAGRRARIVLRLDPGLRERFTRERPSDELFGLVGHVVGRNAGTLVAAVDGLPADASEDELKALGAAAASSGSVALCHVVGVTPEAPTLDAVTDPAGFVREVVITGALLADAWRELTTARPGVRLAGVSIGTPHFSLDEFARLRALLDGRAVHDGVTFHVSTGRGTLAMLERDAIAADLADAGVTIVTDTCTYITPIVDARAGALMSNSAKWAWYAPGNIGAEVIYGSLADCVESAVRGEVVRERPSYLDD